MKRSKNQAIGAKGERMVALWVEETGLWVVRKQEEDFGIDLEAELVEPEIQGHIVKIQVKSSKRLTVKNGCVVCRLESRYLRYAMSCRVPIIVALVDVVRKRGWYVWLQGWVLGACHAGTDRSKLPKTIAIQIPPNNTLKEGLTSRLKEIASWRTGEQLVLGLLDCIRSAFAIQEDSVIEPISRMLEGLRPPKPPFPTEALVDEVIALGERIWATPEGNKLSRVLFTVFEKFGNLVTREQVFRLVTRHVGEDQSYSRTGITAVGLLYKHFPEHARSLKLADLFGNHAGGLPRYFCQLFEKFPDASNGMFYFCSDKLNLRIGDWDIPKQVRGDLFDKLANRGNSALLDVACRVPEEERARIATEPQIELSAPSGAGHRHNRLRRSKRGERKA
jgi:hypothetical protein